LCPDCEHIWHDPPDESRFGVSKERPPAKKSTVYRDRRARSSGVSPSSRRTIAQAPTHDPAFASENGPGPAPFVGHTLVKCCPVGRFPFSSPRDIAAVDLNFNGFPELMVASYGNDTVYVLQGQSNLADASGLQVTAVMKIAGYGPRTFAVGDVNEDGRVDVLVGDQKIGIASVLLNNNQPFPHFR
jgi:hypothetical protein